MISDGCTGFQWAEALFPVRACCEIHDAGGTDGGLLDCLMQNTPPTTWPIVGLCVAVMILVRPAYRWFRNRR